MVPGLDPESTTVNLFDYDMGRLDESTGDLNRPLLETDEASVYEWWFGGKEGKNINSGRLLTFGTGMKSFMGYWNQGSGSSQGLFSYNNPGFPFMVAPTLSEGQPSLSDRTDPAGSVLVGYNGNPSVYKDAQRGEAGDGDRIFASAGARNVATGVQYLADHLGKYGDAAKVQQGNGSFEGGSLPDDLLSLGYLFDGSDQPGKTRYENVTGLFQLDDEGYYYYNMRRNFAEFTEDATEGSAGHFTLYDAPAVNGTNSVGGFFPFDPATEVFRVADGKLENAVAADNSKEHNLNHHLGMTVETVFRQPSGGTIGDNGAPMTFQFSGDDDVWVFIDDVLVLDLGGIHSELFGTIDFATGEVLLGPSYGTKGIPEDPADFAVRKTTIRRMFEYAQDPDGASDPYASRSYTHSTDNGYVIEDGTWQGDAPARTDTATVGGVRFNGETFASDTGHSLKMFYLERGNYDSSLSLRFNLQPELFQEVVKVDQYGNPLAGAEFDLYAARSADGSVPTPETAPSYADSAELRLSSAPVVSGVTTGDDGVARFVEGNGDPLNFADRYNQATGDGLLYVLRETRAPAGYKSLPQDIVLSYNPATSQFRVNNRYQTGAYAGFNVLVTGQPGGIFYGDFAEDGGLVSKPDGATPIDTDTQRGGLVLAVPMLRRADAWLPLYGDNLNGFDAVEYERSDDYGERLVQVRRATLAGALRQAALYARDSGAQPWYLGWDEATGRIAGTLYDLPGRSDRYLQVNAQGDMRMLYGFIDAEAIAEVTGLGPEAVGAMAPEERYRALGQAVQGDDVDGLLDRLDLAAPEAGSRGYSAVDIRDFVRNYRSVINVPNEVRQLRVMKVDQKGAPVNGATFSLYDNAACEGAPVAAGTTATVDGVDGMLVFGPGEAQEDGHGRMVWPDTPATSDNSSMATYYLKETGVPEGYEANDTVIPVKVGVYSIYADAGDADDGVTVMAGVGKLTQTMVKYTKGDVNITLRRILAAGQTKPSGGWDGDWTAMELPDSGDPAQPRIMRLVYGQNALVDYGLSDEDGGRTVRPFFVTDTGYVRAAVSQDTQALRTESGASGVNFDDIEGRDITGLFSLLNVVVVTDREVDPEKTGTLEVSKTVVGDGLTSEDYLRSFSFTFEFTDGEGRPLDGDRSYHFIGRDEWGSLKSGDTIPLHHGETIEVRGLPAGTRYRVTETVPDGSGFYTKTPYDAVHEGVVEIGEDDPDGKVFSAPFVNAKGAATLRLVKTDGATSAPLAGVTFELYALGEGGEAVGDALERATTAEDGSVTLTHGFPETGSARFALREVAAPDGYAAPAAPIVLACDDGVLSVANPRESGAQMGDAVGGAPVVEVANVPTATLSLSKEVLPAEGGSGLTDDQRNQAFTFDVAVTVPEACALPERLAVSVASDGGEPEETEVAVAADSTDPARGTFGLGLSHGQTATVSGLPVGTEVEVTEGDAPGYQAVDKVLGGVVESDGCALGFTNTAVWPDLSIEKSQSATGDPDSFTDGPIAVVEGQTVTYRLTVTNGGDDAARGVTVTDAVPQAPVEPAGADGPALAYVDGSARVVDGAGEASYDDGTKTVTWVLGDLPAGESRTVEFQVTVPAPLVTGITRWQNVGEARYANDPDGGGSLTSNEVEASVTVPVGGLYVSKVLEAPEITGFLAQREFTFSVTFRSGGGLLPAEVEAVRVRADGTEAAERLALDGDAKEASATFSLTHGEALAIAGLAAGTTYRVSEVPQAGFEADTPSFEGEIGSGDAPVRAAFANRLADPGLEVAKTQRLGDDGEFTTDPLTAAHGATVTYRITVTNHTGAVAEGVTVTDAVPQAPVEPAGADGPALAYVDGSARVVDGAGEASYDDGTKTVTWVLGDLPAGESRTVEFSATVPWVGEATEWENVGVARYANNPHGPDAELPTDPVRVGTDLGTGALGVSKTVTAADGSEPTDDQRGARFHFTVRLAHPRVPLPAQVTVDYGDGGAPMGSETVTLANYTQLGGMLAVSLSHGQTATVRGLPDGTFYTVTEDPAEGFEAERDKASGAVGLAGAQAAFVNRALPPDEPDPVLGSLSIAKTVAGAATDDDRARAFTFSLSLLDGEGRPLAGSFPATMADGSASEVSHGSTFALAHGQQVTVDGLPQGTRYAVTEEETEGFEAVSVGQEGVVPGDAEASATFVNVREPQDPEPGPGPGPEEPVGDVAVSKTVDPAGAQDGDFERAFTFVLSLTDGDGAPLGGTVDAELLDGADVSSLTLGDGGRFELRHGQVLLIHGLPVGTRYAVAEEPSDGFTAAEPTLEGVVEEGSSTGSLAFVNRRVAPPALKVEKTQAPVAADGTASGLTSDGLQVPEGATVEYRLTVTNTGEAAAEDVEVSDEVPATATKTSPGTSAPAGTVDLPLTYVDGSASDGGVFRPADADGAARVTWRLGTLAGGESRTVSFRVALPVPDAPVTPEDSGAVWSWRNVAVARFANNPDNPADPSDPPADIPSNPVDVEEGEPRPLVEIHKHQHVKGSDAGFGQEGADSPLPVEPGDTVVYRLRVVNNGAGAAPDVVVRDPLPDGLAYVEGSASHGGVYDGGARTLVWHLGELASRGTVELTFEVEVPTVAEATVWHNVAVADHGTPDDPSSRVEVPPSEDVFVATDVAHLALRKEQSLAGGAFTADPVEGRGGDLLTYRLAVTNDGAAVARGVTVTDTVPQTPVEPSGSQGPALGYVEGSAGIAGSPEAGSFDVETGTVSWDVGDLRPGQTVFVHFSVRLPEVAAGAKVTWENVGVARFENDPAGPGTDIPSNGVEVTVEGDPDPVTPPDEPAPATGSIAVSKTVEGGDEGHRQTAFVFELVLTDAQGEPLAGDFGWERSDGASGTVASGDTLELSHGQIAVVGGLPEGTRWTLTEREAEGFSAREPSLGGEVPAGGVATAVFVNVVDEDPGEPDDPNGPDDPGGPEGPGDPGEPEDPGKPDDPEGPDDPNGPEDPEGPDDPAAPDDPGEPGAPDGPTGTPDGPGPGASRPTAGAGGRSTGAARIASTGDVGAPVLGLALAAAVVAAGLVRAVRR